MSIYKHFRPEERPFVQKMEEWAEQVNQYHQSKKTDFLDPRQAYILHTIVNRYPDTKVTFYGGYAEAERKVGLMTPDYWEASEEQAGIALLSINGDTRFIDLDHGDYMGAILGLGIKREKVGDILVHEQGCHLITVRDIAPYITTHLQQVHRSSVSVQEIPLQEIVVPEQALEEKSFTVASLRLDAVASDAFGWSRTKIMPPIQSGKVKVNWKVETDASATLSMGDVVSIKGLGRFKVQEVEGPTKKGRIRITIGKFR